MGATSSAPLLRYLPHVFVATTLVVLAPAAVVWTLVSTGATRSFAVLLVAGLTASALIGLLGRAAWRAHEGSDDLLFSDLMLWGWVRRWRVERKLGDAVSLLGLNGRVIVVKRGLGSQEQIDALKDLATSLEPRDPYTHGHSRRVAQYAAMIAKGMNLPEEQVRQIRTAAAVHDVGKLRIPLEVLNKPGTLTEEEFDQIKQHSSLGAEMVASLGDDELTAMVVHHHERLDGTGYPHQIGGAEIPIGARVIAVADTFDALTSTRAYRGAKSHKTALDILRKEAGTQLDPAVVSSFMRCYSGFTGIAIWGVLSDIPQRLASPLTGQAQAAAAGTFSTKALSVQAATAATGGGAAASTAIVDPRDTSVLSSSAAEAAVDDQANSA